ncbi:MAG: hypothetical protein Sapg2KO_33590 [Saprospiraceae bacterium]
MCFSCGNGSKSIPAILSEEKETPKTANITEGQQSAVNSNGKFIAIKENDD